MIIEIEFTDGTVTWTTPDKWPLVRGDGVYEVKTDSLRMKGSSLYWVYRDGEAWVFGQSGTVGRTEQLVETLQYDYGSQTARVLEFMPDMPHSAVKLGWWRR